MSAAFLSEHDVSYSGVTTRSPPHSLPCCWAGLLHLLGTPLSYRRIKTPQLPSPHNSLSAEEFVCCFTGKMERNLPTRLPGSTFSCPALPSCEWSMTLAEGNTLFVHLFSPARGPHSAGLCPHVLDFSQIFSGQEISGKCDKSH